VAVKHYLQVTDEHFAKAVQNPVQQVHASGGTESQAETDDCDNSNSCDIVRVGANQKVAETGLEPVQG